MYNSYTGMKLCYKLKPAENQNTRLGGDLKVHLVQLFLVKARSRQDDPH